MTMQSLVELMSIYHHHHTKDSTKMTHFIGVPSIIFALQILLSTAHIPGWDNFTLAWIGAVILLAYYLVLDVSLSLVTACFLIPLTFLAQFIVWHTTNSIALFIALLLFIIGWIFQLIGHYHYEKNKPALLESFFQIFVAPIFLAAEFVFMLGYKKELQKKVHELSERNYPAKFISAKSP